MTPARVERLPVPRFSSRVSAPNEAHVYANFVVLDKDHRHSVRCTTVEDVYRGLRKEVDAWPSHVAAARS